MTANALVTTRINAETKAEAAAVLAQMGLSVSDAMRMLLTKIARERALPFDTFTPNDDTIAAMQEARRGNLQRFDDLDDMMKNLHAPD